MDAAALAGALDIEIGGRLAGGEGSGSYAVFVGADRSAAVLKFDDGPHLDFERAAATVGVLGARGYPVARVLRVGTVGTTRYAITERVRGDPVSTVTDELVSQYLSLNALQRDVGLPGRAPWVEDMVTSVTEGRTGFCEHEAMRAHSREAAALLDRLRRIADGCRSIDPPVNDVVHTDFAPPNTLADAGHVTAVVDWEGATAGDAAFDLVTMAFYTYDAMLHARLLDAARARTDPRALQLYAAHMVLRQVDWSLRHHDDVTVRFHTDVGLALLEAVGAT